MIITVGYRTNSKKATKFRQWATEVLKSYIIKGYSINKEKLKNLTKYGKDYFDELLEIRTSERRFYQKVTDIFAEVVSIIIKIPKSLMNFMQQFKINFTMPLLMKLLLK